MAKGIVVDRPGGPEVMALRDVEVGDPGPGQIRIRHTAIGVNFIDVYYRTGLYKSADGKPFVLGMEGVGVVEATGADVHDLKVGDRVAYVDPIGSYSTNRLIPAARVVPVPAGIADDKAAAMMLKGMTARYLLRETYRVKAGDFVLVHAAAGGVGLILCQWAAYLGATVIGTVGTPEKAEQAQAHGCHHTILYRSEDFVAKVNEITGGKKCHVAYDSVGKDTFPGSLDSLRRRGMWVTFGQSSGPLPDMNPMMLAQRGGLFMTRPSIYHYVADTSELLENAKELFEVVGNGTVEIEIAGRFPLAEAADAHRSIESRNTVGSTVLIP